MDLLDIYRDAYLAIRAKHGHPDEPMLYRGWVYCETLPPKGWDRTQYGAYFDEAHRLTAWYLVARTYAAKKRKTTEDRSAYLAACDRYAIDGHDLWFAGEPAQAALI
ncbi:hypothetical protein [Acrocarpospora sp. B8E8]|uniref:hypothetical protein n=1 Tax=Acrocarpospora sp. B8E8 TaxID=3153572 RepID=UPI00325F1E11